MAPSLSHAQRLAWLQLIRSENVGPVTFRSLVNHFGSAAAALDALPSLAARGGRRIRVARREDAERELAAVDRLGGAIVALGEADYPPWLRHVEDAPPLLTVLGDVAGLARPMAAIVGSRNASVAGRRMAALLARDLGRQGLVVASGLARGIDAAAHEAALDTGTVAVLAGGVDRIYPAENVGLAERIAAAGGSVVSEMPLGWEPRARDFPRRNRLVSGLALAVVVVEAAERSGSLITARLAAEQGRLVFAVPGSPLDPRAGGANRLIKTGAHLVTEADDVLSMIAPMLAEQPEPPPRMEERATDQPPPPEAGDPERQLVLEALGPTPTAIDDVIRHTGLRPAAVHLVILELDLSGRLERHGAQLVSLV